MASFDPQDFGFAEPPPRPTTPPVRRGFLLVLATLCLAAALVYGIPYVAEQTGHAYEAGRSRAAIEALTKLDKAGAIQGASNLFRIASRAVAPAVVHINTQRLARGGDRMGEGFVPLGVGSGVVVDKVRGYIVTNNHVIRDPNKELAGRITVRIGRGAEMVAKVLGSDPKTDLAVLEVKGPLPVQAEWGDSDKLDIGDWVLAIGSPFNLDQTVTAGIVSATGRSNLRIFGDDAYEDFIQTDASINPGNSGGPLIDLRGKIVGINTAIYSEGGGNQGIGLAISQSIAKRVVDQLITDKKVTRGYLGVRIQPVTPAMAEAMGLPEPTGALVAAVVPGSPAEKAALKPGDVIVSLARKSVTDPKTLQLRTIGVPIGTTVPVEFFRDGKKQTAQVSVTEMVAAPAVLSLGFTVRELSAEEAPGPSGAGVYVDRVIPGSPAAAAGLVPDLRIVQVGRQPIRTKTEYELASSRLDPSRGLLLQVLTPDGQSAFVAVGVPGGR